jgi:ribonuclease D
MEALVSLPPHKLITTPQDWEACLARLESEPQLAIDLEANSMFAYREQVCLIQISIPGQDYIIDPLAALDLGGLGRLLADPAVVKVFHAAEYDLILLKRQYDWDVHNLFDTMWAARILGYRHYGLAGILKKLYQVKLDKRFQKSNWCKRPLMPAQLAYAQLDTHYLLRLKAHLSAELEQAGRMVEAAELFAEQTAVKFQDNHFNPDDFRSINGARHLNPQQQAILRELYIYRDQEAQRRNQPLFKIFGDRTLLELAELAPTRVEQLHQIHGMTTGQVNRYGHHLLRAIQTGQEAAPPVFKRHKRQPEAVVNRYERLHNWRKRRAQARGVESDVIIGRETLWTIAEHNPKTTAELAQLGVLGEWRYQTYAEEILNVLRKG